MSSEKVKYETTITIVGGREGSCKSTDGKLELVLAPPEEVGGTGKGTNPEQLFAAGFGACFESTVRAIARRREIDIDPSRMVSTVALVESPAEQGQIDLRVQLRLSVAGPSDDVLRDLVAAAKRACPYSRATMGNIQVEVEFERTP